MEAGRTLTERQQSPLPKKLEGLKMQVLEYFNTHAAYEGMQKSGGEYRFAHATA